MCVCCPISKVKVIPVADRSDSGAVLCLAITCKLRVSMLSSAEKAGFCVTSEQAAAAQWSGKLNIYGKHNEEDMMSVLESACSFFF